MSLLMEIVLLPAESGRSLRLPGSKPVPLTQYLCASASLRLLSYCVPGICRTLEPYPVFLPIAAIILLMPGGMARRPIFSTRKEDFMISFIEESM